MMPRRRERLELQGRIQAIINDSSADARLCADDPDFHIPLAERLVDLVAEEVARAARRIAGEIAVYLDKEHAPPIWQHCVDIADPTRSETEHCNCRWHNSMHAYCYRSCGCNGNFPEVA